MLDLTDWSKLTAFSFSLVFIFVASSLYYDEDGDLAHEFYEETVVTKNGRKKSKLKRIQKNLIPQVSSAPWDRCYCYDFAYMGVLFFFSTSITTEISVLCVLLCYRES